MSHAPRAFIVPLVSFGVLLLLAYLMLIRPVQLHYWQMFRQQYAMDEKLKQLQEQNRQNTAILASFARQREFRQHILRQRLGYAEADEMVYIFEDSDGTPQKR
ncbi:MAG: hypothetical protein LBD72_02575 [Puniceicoccales bacterium]|jgi:hypothetical protein|nr:hypothetical protein [Puniceicoccales bacterium]